MDRSYQFGDVAPDFLPLWASFASSFFSGSEAASAVVVGGFAGGVFLMVGGGTVFFPSSLSCSSIPHGIMRQGSRSSLIVMGGR